MVVLFLYLWVGHVDHGTIYSLRLRCPWLSNFYYSFGDFSLLLFLEPSPVKCKERNSLRGLFSNVVINSLVIIFVHIYSFSKPCLLSYGYWSCLQYWSSAPVRSFSGFFPLTLKNRLSLVEHQVAVSGLYSSWCFLRCRTDCAPPVAPCAALAVLQWEIHAAQLAKWCRWCVFADLSYLLLSCFWWYLETRVPDNFLFVFLFLRSPNNCTVCSQEWLMWSCSGNMPAPLSEKIPFLRYIFNPFSMAWADFLFFCFVLLT